MKQSFKYIIGLFLLLILNALGGLVKKNFDLTKDQRYSINPMTADVVDSLDQEVLVTVFLEGSLPSSFKKYRKFIDYYLKELKSLNRNIRVQYIDPTSGTIEEVKDIKRYFQSYGIVPISRRASEGDGMTQKVIYPYISIENNERVIFVDLLEAKRADQSEQEAIHNSQINLESKLIRAFRDVKNNRSGLVGVLGYNNDLLAAGWNNTKGKLGNYFFIPMTGDQVIKKMDDIELVVSILNTDDLSRIDQLAIDQAMVREIPIFWLIDSYKVSVDSIGKYGSYAAIPKEFNTADQLFKYGVRIGTDLIMDMNCSPIQQVVGSEGGQPQLSLIKYPYHPLLSGFSDRLSHLSAPVNSKFVSSIEILKSKKQQSEVLLTTSSFSRNQKPPVSLEFNFLRKEPLEEEYNSGPSNIAVWIKGGQQSYFNNRLTQLDKEVLAKENVSIISTTERSNQIIVGDSDFALPLISKDGTLLPIGYNNWDRRNYDGNIDFLQSCIELLINDGELLSLKKRENRLQLIDEKKFEKGYSKYLFMLLGLPITAMVILYLALFMYRKLKYAKK